MRALILVAAFGSVAHADEDEWRDLGEEFYTPVRVEVGTANRRMPGFANDPISNAVAEALAVRTRDGYSLAGALPADAEVWLDGFAVPGFHHGGRSVPTWTGSDNLALTANNVDPALGPVTLVTATTHAEHANAERGELTTKDATASFVRPWVTLTVRASLADYARSPGGDRVFDTHPNAQDAAMRRVWKLDRRTDLVLTMFAMRDAEVTYGDSTQHADQREAHSTSAARLGIAVDRRTDTWEWRGEHSVLLGARGDEAGLLQHRRDDQLALDTRQTFFRYLHGLYVYLGAEAHGVRHDLDIAAAAEDRENTPRVDAAPFDDVSQRYRGVIWKTDLAATALVDGKLADRIHVDAGLRAGLLDGDLAIQPRAELRYQFYDSKSLSLAAAATRQAPDRGDELLHALHPERTTQIMARLVDNWRVDNIYTTDAMTVLGFHPRPYYDFQLYYLDRTNLVVRDALGSYANTGRGTTYGTYAMVGRTTRDHWVQEVALRLEHSDRQDSPRQQTRPFEYDQPVRLEARVTKFLSRMRWSVGARFEVREGLPYTPVAASTYDVDRDVYLPAFARLYSGRLPWQHQLDLRVQRTWKHAAAYVEITNVYNHRGAVGYDYNFDFTQRRAIQAAPITPMIGIRGEL